MNEIGILTVVFVLTTVAPGLDEKQRTKGVTVEQCTRMVAAHSVYAIRKLPVNGMQTASCEISKDPLQ